MSRLNSYLNSDNVVAAADGCLGVELEEWPGAVQRPRGMSSGEWPRSTGTTKELTRGYNFTCRIEGDNRHYSKDDYFGRHLIFLHACLAACRTVPMQQSEPSSSRESGGCHCCGYKARSIHHPQRSDYTPVRRTNGGRETGRVRRRVFCLQLETN